MVSHLEAYRRRLNGGETSQQQALEDRWNSPEVDFLQELEQFQVRKQKLEIPAELLRLDEELPPEMGDLATEVPASPAIPDLETNSRSTLVRMFREAPELEKPFSFKVRKGSAPHYLHSMRSALTRGRIEAQEKGRKLQQFKLLLVGIETQEDHDLVTIVRSHLKSMKQRYAYDELIDFLSEEPEEKEE